MKSEKEPNFPVDGKNDLQSTSKKRKETPNMLEEKTKSELLTEARDIGITGRHQMRKGQLIHAIRNNPNKNNI